MIEAKHLVAAGASVELAGLWQKPIGEAVKHFEINNTKRISAFLAQVGHESNSFRHTVENLNYSVGGLRKYFSKYFPSDELAAEYARQPEKIANLVYANRMGNSGEDSGDGWKFRGRGLIQLTGRANVRQFSLAFFGDDRLTDDPEPLKLPELASASAAWYWHDRKLNQLADEGKFADITYRINGGLNGLDDRTARWEQIKKVMELKL